MSGPQLRVVPSTDELMARLGNTTIAELLGSYAGNLDERDRLFGELLRDSDGDVDMSADHDRQVFGAWLAAGRRLDLYRLLARELVELP